MAMLDPRTIGAHIRMKRPSLSALEQKVLDNIIARDEFSEETPIKSVAVENQVSEAMIVKIAKKLDFSGYREFRSNLVLYRQLEVSRMFQDLSADDDMDKLVQKVFRNSIQALEETMAILDIQSLNRSKDIISRAKRLLFIGVGGSAQIAFDFSHKLLRIGIGAHVINDSHMMMMAAALADSDTAVMAISHSGHTKDVIEALKLARSNGARTIAVTNYGGSPVCDYADAVLTSTSRGGTLLGENAASRIAQLNILDVLYVAIAQQDLKKSEENLSKTTVAVRNKRI